MHDEAGVPLDVIHIGADEVPAGVWQERANVSYPGMAIHYTTDGGTPTLDSPRYDRPVEVDGPVALRVFDTRGRGGRTVTLPEPNAIRSAAR